MAITASQTSVQQLYIAYFGRPADAAGLAFYADALDAETTTVAAIATSFGSSAEAATIVALDTSAYVSAVYLQAFGRAYSSATDGTFWTDAITAGTTTKELAMVQILNGASGTDATAVANKVAVADTYTTAVTTNGKAYSGATAAAAAKVVLDGVTAEAGTLTTGNAAAAVAVTALASAAASSGTAFTLTSGVDTITGSADADTITGVTSALSSAATFGTTDVIDGGDGADTLTLNLASNHTGMTSTGAVTNVETISLTNSGTVARTFDGTGITGATSYTISGPISNISDMSALATITMAGQQSAFTTAMDSTFTALNGTTDAMTLNVSGIGRAAVAASTGVEAVTEVAVTATLGSIEAVTYNATGTNIITNGGTNTSLAVMGSGSAKINAVATTLTSFDASTSTGNITVDLQNAAASALTTVATGSGNDTITMETADILANGTISGSTGTDTLSLISAAGGTVQYTMTGIETVASTNVDTALTFSGANSSGVTTASTVAANSAGTTLVNMGAGALTINGNGAVVTGGSVSSDHTGTTTVNLTALAAEVALKTALVNATVATVAASTGALTVNVGEYVINTGSIITAAKASSVTLNVASGKSSATIPVEQTEFDGALTAALAASIEINATGIIDDTAAITVATATQAIITNGANVGAINLQAALLEELTLTSGKAFDMSNSELSTVQVLNATVNDGLFDMTDTAAALNGISTLTVGGTGVTNATAGTTNSSATFNLLGGNNAYDMNVIATGLKGGFTNNGTTNVAAGQNITFTGSSVTGAVTFTGAIGGTTVGTNVTLTTAGTAGNVGYAAVSGTGTITVTNSGAGTFDIGAISAGVTGDVVIDVDGTVGVATLATIAGKTVNLDVSDTIGGTTYGGAITALNSATVALSSLQANALSINTAVASTTFTAAVTGSIRDDDITITGVATNTTITASGDYGLGDDTLIIDNDVTGNAADTLTVTATNYEFSRLLGGDAASVITGGADKDFIVTAKAAGENDIDTAIGGAGNDTYSIVDSGEADIIVEGTTISTGGTDTIQMAAAMSLEGFAYHATTASSAVVDASLAGIEQLVFVGTTAAVDSDQVTGLTLALNTKTAVTTAFTINGDAATADTIDISNFTVAAVGYTGDLAAATGVAFATTNDSIIINGNSGLDTITLNASTDDTVKTENAHSVQTSYDVVTGFLSATDSLDFDGGAAAAAGQAEGYVENGTDVADFAAALAAADIALDGTDDYYFATDGTNGWIFYDADGAASGTTALDAVVMLMGVDETGIAQADLIA